MLIYPWLSVTYERLLASYSSNRVHHCLLLIGQSEKTKQQLVRQLVQTLFCRHAKQTEPPCNQCSECLLFEANTHPDFYVLEPLDKAKKIGVEQIRDLIQVVLQAPQRTQSRFVMIPDISQLTESAANSLLKIIEEPPEQSYFILTNTTLNTVIPTLRSRCLVISLPIPTPTIALQWLKEQLGNNHSITVAEMKTAIKLNSGVPEKALAQLDSTEWNIRKEFALLLDNVLEKRTFLELLSYSTQHDGRFVCYWLASLFLDINKYHQELQRHLLSDDLFNRIARFATLNVTAIQLNELLKKCLITRDNLINIQGVNQELLLVELFIHLDAVFFV